MTVNLDSVPCRDPEATVATLQIGLEYQSGFFSFFCCFRRSFWHP
jgi:hypothetical protein